MSLKTQFSLSWDSYKSSICNGLSALQQNGEFVDMTLAADGYIVKVHQMIIALASPYLKEMINSAPCQHPVIFLNNIDHQTLSKILEYIYTGEVLVSNENLQAFMQAAKALHIKGLDMHNFEDTSLQQSGDDHYEEAKPFFNPSVHIPLATNVSVKKTLDRKKSSLASNNDYSDNGDTRMDDDDRDSGSNLNEDGGAPANLQFTVSNRGALQVILNRYLYNLHSSAHKSGMRRWRCVDYRNLKCQAYVLTQGNYVTNRCIPHNHPFHDKRILRKIETKSVYSAIEEVNGSKAKELVKDKDKQGEDSHMEDDFEFDTSVNNQNSNK